MTLTSRTRGALVTLLVLASAAVGGVVTVQAADPPAPPQTSGRAPAPSLRPATADPGATVRVKGRLGTTIVRTVVLQRRAGTAWRRVTAVRTDDRGRYRARLTAPAADVRVRIA